MIQTLMRGAGGAMVVLAMAGCGSGPGDGPPGGGMAVNVTAVVVTPEPLEETLALVGSISANESVELRSEIDGAITAIHFEEGQSVDAGQLLIELDTRKGDAQVAEAEANYALALANRDRAAAMWENQTISRQEFDQAQSVYAARQATLELVRRQREDSRIVAPFDGRVGARLVSPGAVIGRNQALTSLVDLTPVKIDFRVPERFLGQLRVGQTVTFRVAAYPEESFDGEVFFVDPQVDPDTRTVQVKATSPNTDERLRPGMFGNIDLVLRVQADSIMVPEAAVLMAGDRASLFVVDSTGHAAPAAVRLGRRVNGRVEIVTGLNGGETVVVEGHQKLRPGAPVNTNAPAAPPTP